MKKWEKLQMGDIETQAVIYQGTNLVAHRRQPISPQPQFTFDELKEIVLRWNAFEYLFTALESFPEKLDSQTYEQFYNCCISWIRTHKVPAIAKAKTE